MTEIIGKKLGMSQIFTNDGKVVPVTVIEAGPCCVLQVKTVERDGYDSVKLGFSEIRKAKRVNKPMAGVFKKAGVKPHKVVKEFRIGNLRVGEFVNVGIFSKGDRVNVSGVSKGKGFQGVMKRHHYSGGPGSHGSMFNRAPGSIGASSFPSRVWKNKGLPGHMGSAMVTVRNLRIADVKPEQNLLLIEGAVPGASGSIVEIRKEA